MKFHHIVAENANTLSIDLFLALFWGNLDDCVELLLQMITRKEFYVNVFGHRTMKISHPVRSAVNKHRIDRLVLQWVTMWESRLLNSFFFFFFFIRQSYLPCGFFLISLSGLSVQSVQKMFRLLQTPLGVLERCAGVRIEQSVLSEGSN